jgi:hypothetical protein
MGNGPVQLHRAGTLQPHPGPDELTIRPPEAESDSDGAAPSSWPVTAGDIAAVTVAPGATTSGAVTWTASFGPGAGCTVRGVVVTGAIGRAGGGVVVLDGTVVVVVVVGGAVVVVVVVGTVVVVVVDGAVVVVAVDVRVVVVVGTVVVVVVVVVVVGTVVVVVVVVVADGASGVISTTFEGALAQKGGGPYCKPETFWTMK